MSRASPAFQDPAVEARFEAFPTPSRTGLLTIRKLIFETAAATPAVGAVLETLKWGQPAYLTPQTRSGSTIRLGVPKQGGFAIYTHCQTTLLSDFRAVFPDAYVYEGNRAVHFADPAGIAPETLVHLIRSALTYHLG